MILVVYIGCVYRNNYYSVQIKFFCRLEVAPLQVGCICQGANNSVCIKYGFMCNYVIVNFYI